MLDKTLDLNELYIDAITEVLNVGMCTAAASLSEMLNEQIILSVPGIEFVSRMDASQVIEGEPISKISGVHQKFKGAFDGDALLLFPENKCVDIVRAVVEQSMGAIDDLKEMQREAITEIGNIILNACLCCVADMFKQEIQGDMPNYFQGEVQDVFAIGDGSEKYEAMVLLLNMNFVVDSKNIQGYVTFLMDIDSLARFKHNVEKYFQI